MVGKGSGLWEFPSWLPFSFLPCYLPTLAVVSRADSQELGCPFCWVPKAIRGDPPRKLPSHHRAHSTSSLTFLLETTLLPAFCQSAAFSRPPGLYELWSMLQKVPKALLWVPSQAFSPGTQALIPKWLWLALPSCLPRYLSGQVCSSFWQSLEVTWNKVHAMAICGVWCLVFRTQNFPLRQLFDTN